jgi:hypothetical protein
MLFASLKACHIASPSRFQDLKTNPAISPYQMEFPIFPNRPIIAPSQPFQFLNNDIFLFLNSLHGTEPHFPHLEKYGELIVWHIGHE